MIRTFKLGFLVILFCACSLNFYCIYGQTCTLSGSGTVDWDNASPYSCQEGGTSTGASVIAIPDGMILNFNNNSDTWTGNQFVVEGTLYISASGQVDINSDIVVKSGGILAIGSQLYLGSNSGTCDYTIIVEEGGLIDITGSSGASDRLTICGERIAQGGGGCKPFPGEELPFCEPDGGFTGPFAFDETGLANELLPVELLSFNAISRQNNVVLSWQTASELNNDHFTVEKSKDGINYNVIATVQGHGTTQQIQSYEFTDEYPFPGLSYYRLKQTDFDGTMEIFRPVSVVVENKSFGISVYPNPLKDNELNMLLSDVDLNSSVTIRVFDVSGIKVFESLITIENLYHKSRFDFGFLPKGTYLVAINSDSFNKNLKLVRE